MNLNRTYSNQKAFLLGVALFFLPFLFMLSLHSIIPLNKFVYANEHIFIPDNRLVNKPFNMLNSLATSDSQWFLKIASKGYPLHPSNLNMKDKNIMDGLTYAYYPIYPAIVSVINFFLHDVQASAFILTCLLGLILIVSWQYVIGRIFTSKIANKSLILLLIFPFSIFFRGYYTESLQLILLLWYVYGLHKNKFYVSSLLIAMLCAIKGNNLILIPLNALFIWLKTKDLKLTLNNIFLSTSTTILWILFNYAQTGNMLYFLKTRESWNPVVFPFGLITNPFIMSYSFAKGYLHIFRYSMIDSISVIITGFLLILMYKKISQPLWLISFAIWFFPLASSDIMSFSRYQSVNFPMFIFLANSLPAKKAYLYSIMSFILLLFISILFINWHWIG